MVSLQCVRESCVVKEPARVNRCVADLARKSLLSSGEESLTHGKILFAGKPVPSLEIYTQQGNKVALVSKNSKIKDKLILFIGGGARKKYFRCIHDRSLYKFLQQYTFNTQDLS